MRILVDENIPNMTVVALQGSGHDILDVRGTARHGITDTVLWQLAQSESRMIITTDKGFAQRRNERHFGILIIRLRRPNRHRIHDRVMLAISRYPATKWQGLLVTMRDTAATTWRTSKD